VELDLQQKMTRLAALSLMTTLAACGGSEQAAGDGAAAETAQATASGSVCFFEHINFQGQSFCTSTDTAWIGSAWNDRVSSVKVTAGYKVQLFVEPQRRQRQPGRVELQ